MRHHPNQPVPNAAFRDGGTAVRLSESAPDLREAGRLFIAQRQVLGRKKSTLEDYESTLRVHLVPFFGDCTLDEIDVSTVEAFIYSKVDEGKAPKSIQNYLGLLQSIIGYGVKRGWCESNPVALVETPRAQRDRDIRFLTLAELEAVLAASPETPLGRVDRLVFLAAAMTGMRRGEVVALRWQDVDWHVRLIRVRQNFTRNEFGTPKSRGSSRAVPMAPRLADELRAHYDRCLFSKATDLVFAHPELGTVLDPSKLRKRFVACVRRANVRPVRFHDLRHTFGTQMAAVGAPMRAIQEWLGHSDIRTTLIYADFALDPHQGAKYAEQAFSVEVSDNSRASWVRASRLAHGMSDPGIRPPVPPFTEETARQKVQAAEDAWNSRDPERVALAYTLDSEWRNRDEFFQGRKAIVDFLRRKWACELDYRLKKELWSFAGNRISVRFEYEARDPDGQWWRSHGNEHWEFDERGLMRRRDASINDYRIEESERRIHFDQPEASALSSSR